MMKYEVVGVLAGKYLWPVVSFSLWRGLEGIHVGEYIRIFIENGEERKELASFFNDLDSNCAWLANCKPSAPIDIYYFAGKAKSTSKRRLFPGTRSKLILEKRDFLSNPRHILGMAYLARMMVCEKKFRAVYDPNEYDLKYFSSP